MLQEGGNSTLGGVQWGRGGGHKERYWSNSRRGLWDYVCVLSKGEGGGVRVGTVLKAEWRVGTVEHWTHVHICKCDPALYLSLPLALWHHLHVRPSSQISPPSSLHLLCAPLSPPRLLISPDLNPTLLSFSLFLGHSLTSNPPSLSVSLSLSLSLFLLCTFSSLFYFFWEFREKAVPDKRIGGQTT